VLSRGGRGSRSRKHDASERKKAIKSLGRGSVRSQPQDSQMENRYLGGNPSDSRGLKLADGD